MSAAFHHLALTVPDLDAAVRFLTDGLGCTLAFRSEGAGVLDAAAAARLNLPEGSRMDGLALLRAGGGFVELFAFGDVAPATRPWNDGGTHVALAVPDLEAALARAVAAGASACSGINTSVRPGFAGMRWVYIVAPWGQTFELVDPSAAPAVRI